MMAFISRCNIETTSLPKYKLIKKQQLSEYFISKTQNHSCVLSSSIARKTFRQLKN